MSLPPVGWVNEKRTNPQFRGGSLADCELQGVILRDASFEGVLMDGADFSHADLSGSVFYLVLAFGSTFQGANLQRVQFLGGSYADVDFSEADLRGAIFDADNMGGAVKLSGADLSSAKIDGAIFRSVLYSESTKFPEGLVLDPNCFERESS